MALIKCTECGQMISDKATKCPKCGCPIMKQNIDQNNVNMNQQPMHQQSVYYNEGNRENSNKWLYAVIALLLATMAGGGYYFYDKNKQVERDIQQQQQKFVNDSIVRDSIAKVEKARQDSIEQARSAAENKQKAEQKATNAAPQFYGQVSDPDGYTNIRRGPGTNHPIVRQYNSGDYLYYTPQSNGWSLVYSGDKANTFMGYMHTSRIIKINPNQGSNYSSSTSNNNSSSNYHEGYIVDPVDDYVNVRKGPGTNYAIVGQLDTYTDVYYTTTSSNWYKVYDSNYNYLGYVYYNRIKKTK